MRSILPFPRTLKLSQLVHGEVGDFIINAHLGLQHRWPDRRAFDQYKKRLKTDPSARALVIREIAASSQTQDSGVEVVDDLGPDYQFTHTGNDMAKANHVGTQLRVYQLYHDIQQLQVGGGDGVMGVSTGLSERQLTEQAEEMAELGERFGRLSESVLQLYTEKEKGLLGGGPAQPSTELMGELQAIRAEMAELREQVKAAADDFTYFKNHTLWELKHAIADYAVALLNVQQTTAVQAQNTN